MSQQLFVYRKRSLLLYKFPVTKDVNLVTNGFDDRNFYILLSFDSLAQTYKQGDTNILVAKYYYC